MSRASHWPLTLLGGASSLFNVFLPIVMSRQIAPQDVGAFKVFFLYLATVPALSLGIGFTNGTYLWGASPDNPEAKARSAFLLALVAGFFASAVALLLGARVGWSTSLLFFALACPPAVAGTIFEASLVASGQVKKAAVFASSFEFLRLTSLLLAILGGFGITGIFVAHTTVSWAKLLSAGYGLGLISPGDPAFHRERPALLRYALPVSVAAVFDLLILNADRYVLSTQLSAGQFAIYAFGCLMVPPLFVFEQSVNQVLIPSLAGAKPRSGTAAALYRSAVDDLLFFLIPATAGLIALADPLVRMLFTDVYREAALYLSVYAFYYALSGVPQDVLARARGDSTWILRTAVVFGLLALACTYTGARFFGPLGALRAFVLVQLLRRIYALHYFVAMEGCRYRDLFPAREAVLFSVAAALGALAARWASSFFPLPAHAFLLGTAAFVPVYFGIVSLFEPRTFQRLTQIRRMR
ncbi:MAG TPA: oligosaccharide flippase family protein [Bdellovibrionota bacterium]|jgi:O-antigen/teichoic acid export membrane protein